MLRVLWHTVPLGAPVKVRRGEFHACIDVAGCAVLKASGRKRVSRVVRSAAVTSSPQSGEYFVQAVSHTLPSAVF